MPLKAYAKLQDGDVESARTAYVLDVYAVRPRSNAYARKLLTASPNDATLMYRIALVNAGKMGGDDNWAKSLVDQAIRIRPDDIMTRASRRGAYAEIWRSRGKNEADRQVALTEFRWCFARMLKDGDEESIRQLK